MKKNSDKQMSALAQRLGPDQIQWAIPTVGVIPNVEAPHHRFEMDVLLAGTATQLHLFRKSLRSTVHESISMASIESYEPITVTFSDGEQGAVELSRRDDLSWCVLFGPSARGEFLVRHLEGSGLRRAGSEARSASTD